MRNSKGFTLIETAIVIFLSVVLIGILVILFNRHNVIYNYVSSAVRVDGSARNTLLNMSSLVAQAHRICGGPQSVNGTIYYSGAQSLVVEIPSVDNAGTIIANTYDLVAYHLNGSQLIEDFQAMPGSMRQTHTKVLSDTVTSLTFTYPDPDFTIDKTVSVDLHTQLSAEGEVPSNELSQTILLRNF